MRKVEHLLKNFLSRKSIFHKSVLLHRRQKNSTAQEKLRDIQKPNAGIVLRLWLFQFDWHFFRWNRKLQINTLSTYLGVYFISPFSINEIESMVLIFKKEQISSLDSNYFSETLPFSNLKSRMKKIYMYPLFWPSLHHAKDIILRKMCKLWNMSERYLQFACHLTSCMINQINAKIRSSGLIERKHVWNPNIWILITNEGSGGLSL